MSILIVVGKLSVTIVLEASTLAIQGTGRHHGRLKIVGVKLNVARYDAGVQSLGTSQSTERCNLCIWQARHQYWGGGLIVKPKSIVKFSWMLVLAQTWPDHKR